MKKLLSLFLFALLPTMAFAQFKFKTKEGTMIEVKNSPHAIYANFEQYAVFEKNDTLQMYIVAHENRTIKSLAVQYYILSENLLRTMPVRDDEGFVHIGFSKTLKTRYYTATQTSSQYPFGEFTDVLEGEYEYKFNKKFYEKNLFKRICQTFPPEKFAEAKEKYAYKNLPDMKIDFGK